jgi:hypothetical protein
MIAVRAPSSWRARLFAVATVALSGVFTVLMFRSLKLVADAWFIGCAFHADGTKTCRWDVIWLPDPCTSSPPPPPPPPNTLGGSNGTLMHALFMSLAFGLLTPLGSISFTVRETLRLSPARARAAHGLLMTVAVILSVLGLLQQYYAHGGSCDATDDKGVPLGPHFRSMHSWLGMLILALYWLQGPTALVFLSNTRLLKAGSYWRGEVRRYHLLVGGFAVFGGLLSIVTGVLAAAGKLPAGGEAGQAAVPQFWWPMAVAGAVCMALCFVLFAALFEARVPASRRAGADRLMSVPLLAEQQRAGGEGQAGMAVFTRAEVAKHASEHDCWVVVHGKVYDVTAFLPTHPGGRSLLLQYKGTVADEGFDASHELGVLTLALALALNP